MFVSGCKVCNQYKKAKQGRYNLRVPGRCPYGKEGYTWTFWGLSQKRQEVMSMFYFGGSVQQMGRMHTFAKSDGGGDCTGCG